MVGLDYLAYADGLKKARAQAEESRRHTELLDHLVRGSLVATGQYEERTLFEEYFPAPEMPLGAAATDDADVNLDYAGVSFGTPDESEMEILQRMLADNRVTVSGVEGAEEDLRPVPAPQPIEPGDIEQDREWV